MNLSKLNVRYVPYSSMEDAIFLNILFPNLVADYVTFKLNSIHVVLLNYCGCTATGLHTQCKSNWPARIWLCDLHLRYECNIMRNILKRNRHKNTCTWNFSIFHHTLSTVYKPAPIGNISHCQVREKMHLFFSDLRYSNACTGYIMRSSIT